MNTKTSLHITRFAKWKEEKIDTRWHRYTYLSAGGASRSHIKPNNKMHSLWGFFQDTHTQFHLPLLLQQDILIQLRYIGNNNSRNRQSYSD